MATSSATLTSSCGSQTMQVATRPMGEESLVSLMAASSSLLRSMPSEPMQMSLPYEDDLSSILGAALDEVLADDSASSLIWDNPFNSFPRETTSSALKQ